MGSSSSKIILIEAKPVHWQFYSQLNGRSYYYNQYQHGKYRWLFIDQYEGAALTDKNGLWYYADEHGHCRYYGKDEQALFNGDIDGTSTPPVYKSLRQLGEAKISTGLWPDTWRDYGSEVGDS